MSEINPGIRKTVAWLNENGFETCDSGDGSEHDFECDRAFAYVVIASTPAKLAEDADRLLALLRTKITVEILQMDSPEDAVNVNATYDPADGFAMLDVTGVTDAKLFPVPARALKVVPNDDDNRRSN